MKRLALCVIVLCFVLSACSPKEHKKPDDISQQIWDKGLQYAIMIESYSPDGDILQDGAMGIVWSKIESLQEESSTNAEKELTQNLYDMCVGKLNIVLGYSEETKVYSNAKRNVFDYYGKEVLDVKNLDSEMVASIEAEAVEDQQQKETSTPIEDYMKEFGVSLQAKDVQFDIENSVGKYFVVSGTAELVNYYNYGYADLESTYFCARVVPEDGSYSDAWYLYFQREGFDKLFERLKEGDVDIITTAVISSARYEKGQGEMAEVLRAQYY